ncbi:MAG: hypothetical protein HYV67_02475 [Candidatus Taylorbacteria bacterium]|nr:hypothetical protein [Candidatus Taylorbacteria bacterium]
MIADNNLYKRSLLWICNKQGSTFTLADMQKELGLNNDQLNWIHTTLRSNMPIADNLIAHHSYINDANEHRFIITAKGMQAAEALKLDKKEWYEKWWGIIILSLIIAFLIYKFGWNQ